MNQTLNHQQLSRMKENSVDILFKGLKRKVSQGSYSKIKNSYKKKPIQNRQTIVPLANNLLNRSKLKLSVVSNRIADPQQAHEQLLKLKQANHKLYEQNTELLRKIRKQEKIEDIYRKKLQGKELFELDYFRAMQIKLLLEVQSLENQLEEKESLYNQKNIYIKTKKHSFSEQIVQNRINMYEIMIDSPEDLEKIQKEKKAQLTSKQHALQKLHDQLSKIKQTKSQKTEVLNQIKNQIKELKEKFKIVEAQSRRDKNSSQMVNITSLMSSLMTNAEKFQANKEASSTILKNNVSSISVKNRSNIEEIEKQIAKIKEEYEMYNSEIQQFMDGKIKQKILIHKEIHEIEDKERKQREIQNRNVIYNKNKGPITLSKMQRSTANPLKSSLILG